MNIWLVTTGSSDIQLTSDEYWSRWYSNGSPVEKKCCELPFEPAQIFQDSEESYRIAPRVLGRVYEAKQDEVWEFLTFPLLDQFITQLKGKTIDKIILLLTDQTKKFHEKLQNDDRCPYWQDTCELQNIIERYFKQSDKFPDSELIPIILSPGENEPGLDDWNHVLKIVQNKLHDINLKSEPNTVYVSHQAGTPAISSAVQFVSLGKFGTKVQFLVSNEYEKKALEPIESSEYLKGIKFEQAKALLENHDYAAVQSLVNNYLDSETKILLNAAIQWNYAKFDEFVNQIQKLSDQTFVQQVNERSQQWWWTAYEAAYLGVIRLDQGNTVEALFHTFRAFEGLAITYAKRNGKSKIFDGKSKIFGRRVFKYLRDQNQLKWNNHPYISILIDLDNKDEQTRNDILDRRNNLFHNLLGLQKQDIFDAWAADEKEWQAKILGCLNFVSGETLFDSLTDLADVSLMVQVHQKLVRVITCYKS
jgi:hypothetical protein